jgi:hypothetical protein
MSCWQRVAATERIGWSGEDIEFCDKELIVEDIRTDAAAAHAVFTFRQQEQALQTKCGIAAGFW